MIELNINEIDRRVNYDCGPYEWIHPAHISGVDADAEFQKEKALWLASPEQIASSFHDDQDEPTPPDILITDYLCSCIKKRKEAIESGAAMASGLNISANDLIDAALYLMIDLGSHHPATFLDSSREIIKKEDASTCLHQLRLAYESAKEDFVSENIRDFTLMQFEYGSLWEDKEGRFKDILNKEENAFLDKLYNSTRHKIEKTVKHDLQG